MINLFVLHRIVLMMVMFGPGTRGFGEVCSALHPALSLSSALSQLSVCLGLLMGVRRGLFFPAGANWWRVRKGLSLLLLPASERCSQLGKGSQLPLHLPAAAPGTSTDTKEPVLAHLHLLTRCEAGSDCCSHLPPRYSRWQDRQPGSCYSCW